MSREPSGSVEHGAFDLLDPSRPLTVVNGEVRIDPDLVGIFALVGRYRLAKRVTTY
jgi:hypothetical protein